MRDAAAVVRAALRPVCQEQICRRQTAGPAAAFPVTLEGPASRRARRVPTRPAGGHVS
ncbi:hypothetical protein FRAAL4271 [Frankia alni ACN14a]|uniref:Uncharacterized protein n=1 Tax=Frankia alni (strain DSM 45986 / CECT 9034 / ACN14a) TaxID=326424 RepID=Q0RHW0_FRAAA|nr:hypothetical protein FRAAL4271 [Frankia alni ACN14a]